MLLEELYDYYGNWLAIGRELNFAPCTYQGWRKKGYIPYMTQLLIEKKTDGMFVALEEHGKPKNIKNK